jgi:hypothetical protein
MMQKGHAMAQVASCWPLTTEALVSAYISPCGICGEHSGTGTDFSLSSSVSPVNIIPPWLSIVIHHLGDKQKAHWWLHERNMNMMQKSVIAFFRSPIPLFLDGLCAVNWLYCFVVL